MIVCLMSLTERLHRRFITLMRAALDELGVRDVTATQAALLLRIGDGVTTLRDIAVRGYYHGTNPAYNIQRLVESGYVIRRRQGYDRRAMGVLLTEKGQSLRTSLLELQKRRLDALEQRGATRSELQRVSKTLRRLEQLFSVPISGSGPGRSGNADHIDRGDKDP